MNRLTRLDQSGGVAVAERSAGSSNRDRISERRGSRNSTIRIYIAEEQQLLRQAYQTFFQADPAIEVVITTGMNVTFLACSDELRAGPEHVDSCGLDEPPEPPEIGIAGVALVEKHRGSGSESADEPVPHHPAASSEVEATIAGAQIAVQHELLHVLQQSAAMSVDDALRDSGGSR